MLPKKYRLLLGKEQKKEGKKYYFPLFGLIVIKKPGETKFGFIVSSKISPKATRRNRIKRLLRESIRLILPQMKPDFNIIFLARKSLLGKSYREVKREVEKALKIIGILNL